MKYPRRHTRITYEGISFMSVLAFIILGSIIRQINLLVLLSGLMIAPFFFNWRISMKMLERLVAVRQLPAWVHAGGPFRVRWKLVNQRRQIPSWGIRVNDQLGRSGSEPNETEAVSCLASPILPGSSGEAVYQCFLPERGIYEFGPADVSSAFPVGLVRSKIRQTEPQTLAVAPPLGRLTRDWSRFMRAREQGETSQQRRRNTHDGEFFAIRPWASGDNPRQVHWRSSARHGELMVRQYEQRTESRVGLVLDLFDAGLPRTDVEQLLSFVTTVLHQHGQGRHRLAAGLFGDRQLVCRKLNHPSLSRAMQCLATIQPATDNGLAIGLQQVLEETGPQGTLVIVSTRSCSEAALGSWLLRRSFRWIDASRGEAASFFLPARDESRQFLKQATTAAGAAS
jgi:uncharacterized protein (DUF58 family)